MAVQDITCWENFLNTYGQYIYSTPSREEIDKIRHIVYLYANFEGVNVPGPVVTRRRYAIIAGGYAAWLDRRTNSYDDIDIYTTEPVPHSAGLRYNEYDTSGDDFVVIDKYPYQYMHYNWLKTNSNQSIKTFMSDILSKFDMDICAVAYTKMRNEWIKCVRIKPQTKESFLKIKPKRFLKYAKRQRNVTCLKHLALFTLLGMGNKQDLKYFHDNLAHIDFR